MLLSYEYSLVLALVTLWPEKYSLQSIEAPVEVKSWGEYRCGSIHIVEREGKDDLEVSTTKEEVEEFIIN